MTLSKPLVRTAFGMRVNRGKAVQNEDSCFDIATYCLCS